MRNYTGKCEYCGKVFERYSSVRKRFCDAKCRVAWHRLQQRPEPTRKLEVLENIVKIKIEHRQKAIEARNIRHKDAVGIEAQVKDSMNREDEGIIRELESILAYLNDTEI